MNVRHLFFTCICVLLLSVASGQEIPELERVPEKKQTNESFERKRAQSYMFSIMAGGNFRQERYSEPIVYQNSIAGPGEHLNLSLSRNRFYSYTRINLDYNAFMQRFKEVEREGSVTTDLQIFGIKTFTLGLSRGTYLRGLTGGRRILSLEAGIDVSFSDFKSSMSEHYRDENTNGILQITGYSLGSYPLVHVGLGTSIRLHRLAYWDLSVTYYQGLVRTFQYTYDFYNYYGLNGYTEHTSNGSYLAIRTGISVAII